MQPAAPPICVIVPTLATKERAPFLLRALETVRTQQGVRAIPLVVANGPDVDPGLREALTAARSVRLLELEDAGMPAALRAGRAAVDTAVFTELDDDDELLPGALRRRLDRLMADDRPDAVVSNGWIEQHGTRTPCIPDVAAVARDPLGTLLERNWLFPGAALFRTGSVGPDLFEEIPESLEWTVLGALLAHRRRLAFLSEPSVVHYADHPFSLDRSRACALRRPRALRRLLEIGLPARTRGVVRRKIAAEHHAASTLHLECGELAAAWAAHARSLGGAGGWRFLPFTARLLAAPLGLRPGGDGR